MIFSGFRDAFRPDGSPFQFAFLERAFRSLDEEPFPLGDQTPAFFLQRVPDGLGGIPPSFTKPRKMGC
jgi:hypothetical protein